VVSTYAFPSGHTTFVFALATIAWYYHEKVAYFLYVSGLVIGIARVIAGVHYPSDILGGIIVGTVVAYILMLIAQKLLPTHIAFIKKRNL
jgi:undecaprenyl-diphosphatase